MHFIYLKVTKQHDCTRHINIAFEKGFCSLKRCMFLINVSKHDEVVTIHFR